MEKSIEVLPNKRQLLKNGWVTGMDIQTSYLMMLPWQLMVKNMLATQ